MAKRGARAYLFKVFLCVMMLAVPSFAVSATMWCGILTPSGNAACSSSATLNIGVDTTISSCTCDVTSCTEVGQYSGYSYNDDLTNWVQGTTTTDPTHNHSPQPWTFTNMGGNYASGYFSGAITNTADPFMVQDVTNFNAGTNDFLQIRYRGYAGGPTSIRLYYTDNADCSGIAEACAQSFNGLYQDGTWRTYNFAITDAEWVNGGSIDDIRIDFDSASVTGTVNIEILRFMSGTNRLRSLIPIPEYWNTMGYGVQEVSYSNPVAFVNGQIACCDTTADCASGTTCRTSSIVPPATMYSGLNAGGNDNYAYCFNNAGFGQWLDCDQGDYMDYWCGTLCGPKMGVFNGTRAWVPNASWNAVYAGETGVGEYVNTVTYGCCGDDANENYRYRLCAMGFCVTDTNDDACCTSNTDCVYSGVCYSVTPSMTAPWNGNLRVSCTAGTWSLVEDCSTISSSDTDGGNVPLTSGTVRDYTTSGGASCNYNQYQDVCTSTTQLIEYFPNGASYSSQTYPCTSFEVAATGSISDDPATTDTCTGGTGAGCSGGAFVRTTGTSGTDSCTGTCGTGVNSCTFTEWYAADSTDACPLLDTCVSRSYDADTNSNTCQACRGAGYWDIDRETSTGPCCGDDNNEYKKIRNCTSSCVTDPADNVCCDLNTDCSYQYICYPETTGMIAPWNFSHIVSCTAGTWSLVGDCSARLSVDTDGGNMPLAAGTLTDFTTAAGMSCNNNTYPDVCTSATQLTEYFPNGASYSSQAYTCAAFEVAASGSIADDPTTTDTCIGGAGAGCSVGAFSRAIQQNRTDSCTGTCGTGVNSCIFLEWYAADSSDSCPLLDTCVNRTYDADTNTNTCLACRTAGYWSLGGEVASAACCGDDNSEFRIAETAGADAPAGYGDSITTCCDTNTDCTYNDACYPTSTSSSPAVPNKAYCNVTMWYGGDVNRDTCASIAGGTGNWMRAGEAGVGDYSDMTTNECCGDDSGEYNITTRILGVPYTACCDDPWDMVNSTNYCRPVSESLNTFYGVVRNSTGSPIAGARVDAIGRNLRFFNYTSPTGAYNLFVMPDRTYDLVASSPHFVPNTSSNNYMPVNGNVSKNFTLFNSISACEADCTYINDNTCHSDCDYFGGCIFYSDTSKASCNNKQKDWVVSYNLTHEVQCCVGAPALKIGATITGTEVGTPNKVRQVRIVMYQGRPIQMVVDVFM